jgi:hypothetical protein
MFAQRVSAGLARGGIVQPGTRQGAISPEIRGACHARFLLAIRKHFPTTRTAVLLSAGLVLACSAQSSPGTNERSEPAQECYDCFPPEALPWNAAEELSPAHRHCGLTVDNVIEDDVIVIRAEDPQAERKLSCLAAAGDYEVIGAYAHDLNWAGPNARPPHSDTIAYRWAMVALRNYLRSVGIDYDREDFFEAYRRLGERPGPLNANGPSDNIYYYSDVPLTLIEQGRVVPSRADARRLATIRRNRPGFP